MCVYIVHKACFNGTAICNLYPQMMLGCLFTNYGKNHNSRTVDELSLQRF